MTNFVVKFGMKLNDERNYFITSDLHFFHNNIMRFCPTTRPWGTVEEMHEALVEHWNFVVGENDVVFHLGDFAFAGIEKVESILGRLNGTLVFVMGNHDKTVRNQLKSKNKFEYLEVTYNKKKICMFHFPIYEWNQKFRGSIHFYGHQHGGGPNYGGRMMDVGYDAHGRILTLEEAVNTLLKVEYKDGRDRNDNI